MNTCSVENYRSARIAAFGAATAAMVLSLGFALLPLSANSGEKSPDQPAQAWPISVQAHYRLRYAGIDVGRLDVKSNTAETTYSLSGSAKVSALLGAVTWSGSSSVSGTIDGGAPAPAAYAFDWLQNKKKRGAIRIGFKDHAAAEIAVKPPSRAKPDLVPLKEVHKAGALDPMSAVLALTKADSRPPCDRRVGIFDGKSALRHRAHSQAHDAPADSIRRRTVGDGLCVPDHVRTDRRPS